MHFQIQLDLSEKLTGNDLGQLGQLEGIPTMEEYSDSETLGEEELFSAVKSLLANNLTHEALCLLLKNL